MGYDRGDSFPIDFVLNGIPFDSKSEEKLPRSYPIQCERKWNKSFLSAGQYVRTFLVIIDKIFTIHMIKYVVIINVYR